MDTSISGRVALVTGGSRGIGRAIASRLLAEGASVAITYNTSEKAAKDWAEEANSSGRTAAAFQLDLRDPEAPGIVVKQVREQIGEIGILVNNAGVRRDGAIFNQDEEAWREVIQIHLEGAYRMTRSVIVAMLKIRSGVILNVVSVSALLGTAGQTNYAAAKAGLIGFTRSLARESAPRGVRCNAVALGLIDAGITRELSEKVKERILAEIPLGRLGSANEAASAALYLISDRSKYITGQVVPVDGGISM
ncbi:MAG: 3-oxoacyl-ACP reductase FabG [Planctomycetota bacterium]|nr:3-oxoacyl-ACP reductase FabG [Planctomycetota bacterium]